MADLAAAETAREGAVTGKTHADQPRAWSRWERYCGSIEIIEDEFLDQFTRGQQTRIMGAFPWLSVKEDFQDHLMEPWLKAQSEVPFNMSHRPSGKITGQTKQKMKTATLEEFYRGSTEPTKTATQIQNNKRTSPSASSLKSLKRNQQRPNEPQVSWQLEVSF